VLFFEGELGELLPNLDLHDRISLDYGFSVGRQPLELQDGMLLLDTVDSVGIVRNSLHTPWTSGLRVSAIYGWNHVSRNDNLEDDSAQLWVVSALADLSWTTIETDFVYVNADATTGDGFFGGLGAIQRFNLFGRAINTTFRAMDAGRTTRRRRSETACFFLQFAVTPHKTPNWLDLNLFGAIGRFTAAARDREAGGPLITTGLLYSTPVLGRFGPALDNSAEDCVGAALGYQMFFAAFRRQLVLELGGRIGTQGQSDAIAAGARFQQAIGRQFILELGGHVAKTEHLSVGYGARSELIFKF
jgi:hypothetical protein